MRALLLIFMVASAALGIAAPAASQCPERLRLDVASEMEETGRRIEQAGTVVREADHDAAQHELEFAVRLQGDARSAFTAGNCRLALDLTRRARFRAIHAIELVRGLPDPDRVQAQLERTHEVIDQARDRVEECREGRAHAVLRAAFQMQMRADEALRTERPLAALQLTVGARERAFEALRFCQSRENLEVSAERAIHRTEEVIARAQDLVEGPGAEPARLALDRARELLDRARDEQAARRYEPAIRLSISARVLAFRAGRLAGGGPPGRLGDPHRGGRRGDRRGGERDFPGPPGP